jgi:hypothetical protein
LYPLPALVFLAVSVWMLHHIAREKSEETRAGLATIAAGLVIYFVSPKKSAAKSMVP